MRGSRFPPSGSIVLEFELRALILTPFWVFLFFASSKDAQQSVSPSGSIVLEFELRALIHDILGFLFFASSKDAQQSVCPLRDGSF